jgi:hypothetical protein
VYRRRQFLIMTQPAIFVLGRYVNQFPPKGEINL